MAQKVFEFAKEQGIETLILMDKIRKWGDLSVKSHMATLDEDTIQLIRERLESESGAKKKKKKVTKKASSSKKKTTAKKKVAKKAATKKTTVKRATTAKTAAAETSESAAKKTAK